tara:strand:- start:37660 stop:38109 length:450 start_codon:yes stop_codon:yes gene_type:complete
LRTISFNQLKAWAIPLALVPISLIFFSSSIHSRDKFSSKNKNESVKTSPATREDTFLYRQIGVNILCRARLADVEFPKSLGIASATFADIISQKHGGFVEEIPEKKLDPKQLYVSAELQVIEGAIKYCPDKVPAEAKKKFKEFMKKQKK